MLFSHYACGWVHKLLIIKARSGIGVWDISGGIVFSRMGVFVAIVKNKSTEKGREFWAHVESVSNQMREARRLKVEVSDPHRWCASAITDYCNCERCSHYNRIGER